MQISSLLTEQEISKLQNDLYSYFSTGYEFEEFLKEYLIKMGLDEVQVTQRSRDGGVDLTAIRKGVGDFSEIDITHYYIQAKRNSPRSKISVNKIRELKGTIPFGYKGMFITTSDFTGDAASEAINDPSKPVVAINGKSLVMSCIDNSIGFTFKPVFSKEQMDKFWKKELTTTETQVDFQDIDTINYIEKTITSNDVRARIISIPTAIIKQFDDSQVSAKVIVNNDKEYQLNINKGRNYFGSVTSLLREYGLISGDGVITPKQCKWLYDSANKIVQLIIED